MQNSLKSYTFVGDLLQEIISTVIMTSENLSQQFISLLVENVIDAAFSRIDASVDFEAGGTTDSKSGSENEDDELSSEDSSVEFMERRNARVAAIQAEFLRQFPNFVDEVRGLKVQRKRRVKKPVQDQVRRKSSRLEGRRKEDNEQFVNVSNLGPTVTESGDAEKDMSDCNVNSADDEANENEEDSVADAVDLNLDTTNVQGLGKFGCAPCNLKCR